MGKLIFAFIFFGAIAVIALMALGSMGVLPDSMYVSYFKTEEQLSMLVGGGDIQPALEQFEGHWSVDLQANPSSSDQLLCVPAKGYVYSHNGSLEGVLHTTKQFSSIRVGITIHQDGSARGTLTSGNQFTATAEGTFAQGKGDATWRSDADCSGTISFTKISEAVDPVAGRVVSTSGDVTLERGGQRVTADPAMSLYEGDVVITASGASAHLGVGLTNESVELGSNKRYTVPPLPGR